NGRAGVALSGGAQNNHIGGSAAAGNVIAFNQQFGITTEDATTTGNPLRGNSPFRNTGPGIDPRADRGTPNHPRHPPRGPNGLLNFPVAGSVHSGTATAVSATLSGGASQTFTLDFYASPTANTASSGGKRYLGSLQGATDAAGNGTVSGTLPAASGAGEWLT